MSHAGILFPRYWLIKLFSHAKIAKNNETSAISLSDYFAVSKLCYTFVAVNELATTYQRNDRMLGILKFFASFCADYLVNPNNLLTHTHTQAHLASNHTFFAFPYARVKCVVYPINKGLLRVPFVRFFMPFCQVVQGENNNELSKLFKWKLQ